jgi:hypothetical protein
MNGIPGTVHPGNLVRNEFDRARDTRDNQDPCVRDPTQNIPAGYWFNPNCLTTAPPYTMMTSPFYYEGMRGPRYWDLDSTFVKSFKITERYNLEFRMELYNLTNTFIPSDPNVCGVTQCGSVGGPEQLDGTRQLRPRNPVFGPFTLLTRGGFYPIRCFRRGGAHGHRSCNHPCPYLLQKTLTLPRHVAPWGFLRRPLAWISHHALAF